MKKSVTRIGAAILGLVILFGTMTAMASQLYPDLAPNHWCYKKIMEFVDKGYIDGYEDGTMRPDQTITRAEYVKVVNNFFGFKNDGETDKKFSDVSDDAWYAKYVYTAVAQGYISGYEDNTFKPSNPITRQEATVILSRILKIDKEVYPKDHVDGLAQYSDGNEVADWAYTAIHSYSVYNFINGYEDGTLRILQDVTRAETVELLHVLEQKIEIDRPYGRTKTTKMPTINIIVEVGKNEFKPATTVNGWFNNENSCKNDDIDGVYVNITTTTDGATIYEKVNPRDPADRNYVTTTVNDFKNMFFLTDGVYDVSAYAKKTGRKTSGTNKVTLKIDTMAPYVEAKVLDNETNPKSNVAHTQKISVTLKDVIPSGLTEDKVSGVNEDSAKYAWFIESGESFVKVGEWTSFSNGQVVETPTKYGKYKLAVSVKDNAGNSFGEEYDGEIRYDFVEDGETTPSEDIVVEVGNNAPHTEDLVLSTKLGIVASGDIVAFDSDSGDKLTYTIETKPISGEATVDAVTGRIAYTPSEKGTFTFTVKVSDGNESGDTIATVTVKVEDLNYTVNYYLKGTTNKLATSKFVDNQFFSTKILATDEAIAIDGYNYDSADKEELIIGLNENVINLYYTKRTDLSYRVNYLEKETNKVLAPARVVENQTFGDKITESAIEINGYNKVAPTSGEVEITTGKNEITFYYEKRTDLSYRVNYLEKETNKVLAPARVVGNQTFGAKITESAIEIDGYNKVAPTSGEVEITTGKNEITFYYEKRTDLSYTVNYLEKETNKVLAPAKDATNQTFGDKITESAIEIDGYNKVAPTSGEVEITTGTNEITFYYEKRTDLSYTVNYLEKGTNNVLEDAKVVENQTFGDKITESAIEIDGYNKVAPTSAEVEITTGKNEITFYYEKRTDLSYTVNYLEKGTNNVLEDAKVVGDQTFGAKVVETAIEIDGYNKVAPTSGEVEITTGKNEITFYYEKRTDLSYTVNYYLENTTTKVATSKTENGRTFEEEVTENAIDVAGYTKVAPTTKTIKISADETANVINFYYAKRTDLSYTVNYYLENTTTKVANSKTENGRTFEEEVTENAIDVAGYTKVAPTTKTIKISADETANVINFYYAKRTDLSYTVNYYLENTTTKVANSKTENGRTFEEEVTENAIDVAGYTKVAPTTKTIKISADETANVINFYYAKRTDLSYTVNYYLENTTTKVANSKTENGRTFEEEVTENAIDVAGYTKVAPTTKTIKISADETANVINFYYAKRTDLSYTVNYYLENTTTKVADSNTVSGKTFEEEVTENAIDVAGYTKVAPTTKTIKISADESKNVINFYYTKRTDLSYTVNYYLENTTTKVADSKTVDGRTFEEEVTENAKDVVGYTKVEPTTKTIKISADESENVINFYYTKRTDLSYTVNYYLEGTTTKVTDSKTVDDRTFEEEVTENAKDVAGYTKVEPTTKTIKISADESKNVINFYYTKRADLSYTVNYYLEGTTTKVANSNTVSGKTFEEEVTENAIDVAGYTKVAPTTRTIKISANESENVINFYYTKRTDLSYTVNYYLEGTTTKVTDSKTVDGRTFEEEVTENAKDVAGYTKVAPITKTIKISADESENVINFYYTKRTDLSYTVNYYLEGTTTKVTDSKTVDDRTFEEEVTENAKDVAGYTKVEPTTKTIKISADESENVINFYYKKNEGKLIANIECNYPTKDGVDAEPGDTLKYKITLEEDGEAVSYPKTISIKLDADVEKPTNLPPSNASYDETTHTITWTASSKDDKLTYNVKVKKETPAGSKAETTITGATAKGATSVDIESTVSVKVDKNKNVVLVLDISGSMNWCVKHGKPFEKKVFSSKIGHYGGLLGLEFEECSEKSRLEVMKEAAKNFAKSIIDERNLEDITITIVTFENNAVNKGTLKNPTVAQVNKVINKLSADGGTNMRGAIKAATQVLNSSSMLENAVDYVVVLSDGDPEASQYYCDTTTLNAFYATKANAYAIGLGNSYKKDELLKIVNNDSNKVFDAANADKLEEAFKKIGSEINKAQTAEGEIDVNVTGIVLYPIKLSYKDKTSKTVTVTINSESELTANNLSIKDGKLVWDISKYPGCKGFQIEVNRTKTTKTTKTTATLMLLAEEYGLEDVILVYGDPTITDKLPEEIEDVSGEDEEVIDDTVVEPEQPVSGETKVSEETSGDTEIRPEKETSGDSEIQPTDEASGDSEKTEIDDKTSGDSEKTEIDDKTSGDPEKTEVDDKTSGDVEEKTEEVISGDTEPKPTEKTSGDSENKTEEKPDDKDIEPTQETSGNVAKEETKQQEKKTEEPKAEENEQQEEKTGEPKAEENKQQEDEKSEEIIEKEEETKATVEEVVVPEIKDPLENEEKDEKAA